MAEAPAKSNRRFLRFSLRALLLAMLVIGMALGWTLHKVREQGVAVAALEKIGCAVEYADDNSPAVLERLRMWCGEENPGIAVSATLYNSQVTDAGLVHLERLTQLKYLSLGGTNVTDAGLAHLERLTQLETLDLYGTQVTDAGLAHLESLTQLRSLLLRGTHISDAGVEELQKALPNLHIYR